MDTRVAIIHGVGKEAHLDERQVVQHISGLKTFWNKRNKKFREWYEILVMLDTLTSKGLETYISNEPQTFYDMAHYLLTRGELSHSASVETESAVELDRRAKIDRACQYNWHQIDRDRRNGGECPFIDELGFYLLTLGWLSVLFYFDDKTGHLMANLWNPYDTYPDFANGKLAGVVHSYSVTESEALYKAQQNGWNYESRGASPSITQSVKIDDYWAIDGDKYHNVVLYNDRVVDGWAERPRIKLLVAPVAGFPDKGSLTPHGYQWQQRVGRGIFEVNEAVSNAFNKWKSMVSQILRDTAQPIVQEFSSSPQATPEQLRERGGLFHYATGEAGLQRVPPAAIPIEIQAHLMEIRRELQKGSFNDAVWGMVEGQPGYALSMMASSSANQILYPYMDAKHFVIEEGDNFWLSNLKSSKRVFEIKGKLIEKLKPTDIPENVNIIVESDVATPKDWLERSTIANNLSNHLDRYTILKEILNQRDPQGILRKKDLDAVMTSPEAMAIKKIANFRAHSKYLEFHGDKEQARIFRRMADAMEAQMTLPQPGQATLPEQGKVEQQRAEGAPAAKPRVPPGVAPPEVTSGFSPQQLRNTFGKGRIVRG